MSKDKKRDLPLPVGYADLPPNPGTVEALTDLKDAGIELQIRSVPGKIDLLAQVSGHHKPSDRIGTSFADYLHEVPRSFFNFDIETLLPDGYFSDRPAFSRLKAEVVLLNAHYDSTAGGDQVPGYHSPDDLLTPIKPTEDTDPSKG